MSARMGTMLSGVFSIIASHMSFIFEHKHLGHGNCTNIQNQAGNLFHTYIMCWSLRIALFLSLITMTLSFLLLYSMYAQVYKGLIAYTIWIFCYEVTSMMLQIITDDYCADEVRVVRWFGWISRSFLHCFWMFYVIPYAYIIYKSQKQGNILTYNRRISVQGPETQRRKSKILSFIHHYSD